MVRELYMGLDLYAGLEWPCLFAETILTNRGSDFSTPMSGSYQGSILRPILWRWSS